MRRIYGLRRHGCFRRIASAFQRREGEEIDPPERGSADPPSYGRGGRSGERHRYFGAPHLENERKAEQDPRAQHRPADRKDRERFRPRFLYDGGRSEEIWDRG